MTCELCGKEEGIFEVKFNIGKEYLLLCKKCEDQREVYASNEYDRQREEETYDPDEPGHERDIKED
jgi:ribosome-binding protein aMBF1 (putative translation factor)